MSSSSTASEFSFFSLSHCCFCYCVFFCFLSFFRFCLIFFLYKSSVFTLFSVHRFLFTFPSPLCLSSSLSVSPSLALFFEVMRFVIPAFPCQFSSSVVFLSLCFLVCFPLVGRFTSGFLSLLRSPFPPPRPLSPRAVLTASFLLCYFLAVSFFLALLRFALLLSSVSPPFPSARCAVIPWQVSR